MSWDLEVAEGNWEWEASRKYPKCVEYFAKIKRNFN